MASNDFIPTKALKCVYIYPSTRLPRKSLVKESDGCLCEEHGEPRQVDEVFCFQSTVCVQHVYKTMCESILWGRS